MRFHIITIFPEMFQSYLGESILARAIKKKKISFSFYNPRDFTDDKHRRVDDRPYGGGPGMVMRAEPVIAAAKKARGRKKKVKTIILSPSGKQFTNAYARTLAKKYTDIILISGRYEGIDARVKKALRAEEVSVGPYVLTGGELPAMIIADVVARQVSGVLGKSASLEELRTASPEVYTRPDEIVVSSKKYKVPKILLSGDHAKIERWREDKQKKKS